MRRTHDFIGCWLTAWSRAPLTAAVFVGLFAAAPSAHSQQSISIEIPIKDASIRFLKQGSGCKVLTDDGEILDGQNHWCSSDSVEIIGVWDIYYGPTPSPPMSICRLGNNGSINYTNLTQVPCANPENSGEKNIKGKARKVVRRDDIMFSNFLQAHNIITSIDQKLAQLGSDLITLRTDLTAIIEAKLAAMTLDEGQRQEIVRAVSSSLQPSLQQMQQSMTDEVTRSVLDQLKAAGVLAE